MRLKSIRRSKKQKHFFFSDIRFIFAAFIKTTGILEELKAYKIEFMGLPNGKHTFSFDIGSEFFDCFAHSEIRHGDVHLDLHMEKEENMLVFDFNFHGWVEVSCDRCLDMYREPVDFERRIYIKFGEDHSEQADDIIVIPHTETYVDISHYVYEFLHLVLPLRRVHPDDSQGRSGCDPDMLARVKAHSAGNTDPSADKPLEGAPFEALKSLRFKKSN